MKAVKWITECSVQNGLYTSDQINVMDYKVMMIRECICATKPNVHQQV